MSLRVALLPCESLRAFVQERNAVRPVRASEEIAITGTNAANCVHRLLSRRKKLVLVPERHDVLLIEQFVAGR
jgi:hypothetical protein